jgi:DNA repair exonuclease SbcCD nuclease subunit
MMNYLIIGDYHALRQPAQQRGRLKELVGIVVENHINCVIQLGDFFDEYLIGNNELAFFSEYIRELNIAAVKKLYMLGGNHEVSKSTAIADISEVLNQMSQVFKVEVEFVTDQTVFNEAGCHFEFVPYSRCMVQQMCPSKNSTVMLSHIDRDILVSSLQDCEFALWFNGHNHTYKQLNKHCFDVGSVLPFEFDQEYNGQNYYFIVSAHNGKLSCQRKSFKYKIKQRTIVLNSIADMEKISKTNVEDGEEQIKLDIRTKEVTPAQMQKLLQSGLVSRLTYNTTLESCDFRGDLEQLLEIIKQNEGVVAKQLPAKLSKFVAARQKLESILKEMGGSHVETDE